MVAQVVIRLIHRLMLGILSMVLVFRGRLPLEMVTPLMFHLIQAR